MRNVVALLRDYQVDAVDMGTPEPMSPRLSVCRQRMPVPRRAAAR